MAKREETKMAKREETKMAKGRCIPNNWSASPTFKKWNLLKNLLKSMKWAMPIAQTAPLLKYTTKFISQKIMT